jgi:hypothetical protein
MSPSSIQSIGSIVGMEWIIFGNRERAALLLMNEMNIIVICAQCIAFSNWSLSALTLNYDVNKRMKCAHYCFCTSVR